MSIVETVDGYVIVVCYVDLGQIWHYDFYHAALIHLPCINRLYNYFTEKMPFNRVPFYIFSSSFIRCVTQVSFEVP